jgi:hypothetical protein
MSYLNGQRDEVTESGLLGRSKNSTPATLDARDLSRQNSQRKYTSGSI